MRYALGAFLVGFMVFLLVADETPASFLSKLTVMFNGPDYARVVFRDRVQFERILASDNRTPVDPDVPACRVAVVELAADAPQKPPRIPLIEQASDYFGGDWRPTPLSPGPFSMPDLMALCGDRIDGITRGNLELALSEPGSFVIRDWKNNTLQIYAPKAGLAAHLSRK